MTAQTVVEHASLSAATDATHAGAFTAIENGEYLEAVAWMSAHLAAMQHSVHRAARRREQLADVRAADRGLEVVLRRVEQHFAGDSLAAGLDHTELDGSLRHAFELHCRTEKVLVDDLTDSLPGEQMIALAAAYSAALRHAPTRPHPYVPHRGILGALAFRVDAWRDKVMDTMDNRHVPSPRDEPRRKQPGRWGRYFLGEMENR